MIKAGLMQGINKFEERYQWASVASWFFRPSEGLPVSTAAGAAANGQHSPTYAAPVRPLPPSIPSSTSPATSSGNSPQRPASNNVSSQCEECPGTRERTYQPPTICTAIRCTVPNCSCESFVPGKRHLRYCETCKHGWVPHALARLGVRHLLSAPEPVELNIAFDVASLVLFGCQALPIRLKILLDRLFAALQRDQVLQVLHGFGWTQDDYARGYILQESQGGTLDRWSICSPEEEPLVLQQFLRFGQTRAITQHLLLAQQALQEPSALERLGYRAPSQLSPRRTMSPNHRPSPPTFAPTNPFHPSSWLPAMSPHQKQAFNFLKTCPLNDPVISSSSSLKSVYGGNSITSSPLNRLQNMQPFNFQKLGAGLPGFPCHPNTDHLSRRKAAESETPASLNLSIPTSLPMCPPQLPSSSLPSALNPSAAAMVNSLAAASLVASSFPNLIPTNLSSSNQSPTVGDSTTGCNNEMGSEEDDDENSHSALNLSRDSKDQSKILRQPRPLTTTTRKPIPPSKRQWGSPGLPLNLGTQFINPATGKKRVQCNVCLKTFCDKGALKIHFSAVHLREMHKCTVEGCNMMFSSRRSRNRHSANPNPKLHSPHLRRKISPHDGRSAQPHPLLIPSQPSLPLPPSALNSLNPFGPFPMLTASSDLRHPSLASMDFKHTLDLSIHRSDACEKEIDKRNSSSFESNKTNSSANNSNHEDDDYDDDGIVVVGGDEDDDNDRMDATNGISDYPEDFSMPSKRPKLSASDVDEDVASNGGDSNDNEDSVSVVDNQSFKDEPQFSISKRKRKSQNPTKCAVPVMMMDDDVSDGDSSNDVFQESIIKKEERGRPAEIVDASNDDDVKRAFVPSQDNDQPINLGKNKSDVNANEPANNVYNKIKISLAPLFPTDKLKKEKAYREVENAEENEERPSSTVESNKSDESYDTSNALRHLENLSHGNFGDLMAQSIHLGLGVQHSHLAPLGYMMSGDPPSPARSQASSAESSNGADSPDENSENQLFGLFDNGQFISTMDVPIDKDNPRRCAACGKIFQNHFGVKTHYQNVHLKLMHKCNVDGCNAAFPSKRSRDRHSANLNLHRKLLSTSTDTKVLTTGLLDKSPFPSISSSGSMLQNDLFARLYAEETLKSHHFSSGTTALNPLLLNGDRIPPPFLLPSLGGLPFPLGSFNHYSHLNGSSSLVRCSSANSLTSSTPPPPHHSPPQTPQLVHCLDEDPPIPDQDGSLPCRLCKSSFSNKGQLQEHYESNHLSEMYRCTVTGCPKVFASRTRRDLHSEKDSLHPPQHSILEKKNETNSNIS